VSAPRLDAGNRQEQKVAVDQLLERLQRWDRSAAVVEERDHSAELKASLEAINGYFVRTSKTKAAGQAAFDRFGTRTYSAFATVAAQYGFCQTASKIGREVIFTPRGQLGDAAATYMRELRNSLIPYGEQQFPRAFYARTYLFLPDFQPDCWRKGRYSATYCGSSAKKKKR